MGVSQHIKSASSKEPEMRSTVKANPQTWQATLLPFFIAGLTAGAFFVTAFLATDVFWAFALDVTAFLAVVLFAAVFLGIAITLSSPFHSARSQRLIYTVYQIPASE
jgi:VIT1/CCC1 family predicted Fe2+/Mn2+ transporter